MFTPKTILLPVDLSAGSHPALGYAAAFGRHYGATILLQNVQDAELPPNLMSLPDQLISGRDSEWLRTLKHEMNSRAQDEQLRGLGVETIFSGGPTAETILQVAKDRQCDLIVMEATTQVRSRSEYLGSTAEAVVAASPVPVLLVRSVQRHFIFQKEGVSQIALNRIMLATGFEDGDHTARELAIDLARQFSSRLSVVTVMEQVSLLRALLPGTAVKFEETFRENAESSFRALQARAAGLTVERSIRDGAVYREVVHAAVESEADLLVIGASPKSSSMLGTNAERITRLAPCPVLIVC